MREREPSLSEQVAGLENDLRASSSRCLNAFDALRKMETECQNALKMAAEARQQRDDLYRAGQLQKERADAAELKYEIALNDGVKALREVTAEKLKLEEELKQQRVERLFAEQAALVFKQQRDETEAELKALKESTT